MPSLQRCVCNCVSISFTMLLLTSCIFVKNLVVTCIGYLILHLIHYIRGAGSSIMKCAQSVTCAQVCALHMPYNQYLNHTMMKVRTAVIIMNLMLLLKNWTAIDMI